MENGSCPLRSTPAELVYTIFCSDEGQAASRFFMATLSVCSGPLPPVHLPDGKAVVPMQQQMAATESTASRAACASRRSPRMICMETHESGS